MLLVTSANGNQGKLLVPKLLAAGIPLRCNVMSERSARHLLDLGVDDVVVGDICAPGVMGKALEGVKSVYHVGPTVHPQERAIGLSMVDGAREAGVEHFVFSSVLHAITTDLLQHEYKRDIEEHLIDSGLEFTILQPTNYMMPFEIVPAFQNGIYRQAWSLERRQSLVDLDDVTDVVVKVVSEGKAHFGATYELSSEGRHTARDLAATISHVVGRPIESEQITAEEYLRVYFGEVEPEGFQQEMRVLRRICEHLDAFDFVGNANVLRWLLGREPISYQKFVEKHFARLFPN